MKAFLLAVGLLLTLGAKAQATDPPTYAFLTVALVESPTSKFSQLTFAPSFQGKTHVPLEEIPNSYEKGALAHEHNMIRINQQLEVITAAGWEFVQVFSAEVNGFHERQYLFRRRKP